MHEYVCLDVEKAWAEVKKQAREKGGSSSEKLINLHFFFVLRLLCTIFATLI